MISHVFYCSYEDGELKFQLKEKFNDFLSTF